jgi:CDP-paratose 2-epimerase
MSGRQIGISQDFAVGAHADVEAVLEDLRRLGVTTLRTRIGPSGSDRGATAAWHGWLLTRIARDVEVVPVFSGLSGGELEALVARHGRHFEWAEVAAKDAKALVPRLRGLGKKVAVSAGEDAKVDAEAVVLRLAPDDAGFRGWDRAVAAAHKGLRPGVELWVDGGAAAWSHGDRRQLCELLDALSAPADRLFWRSARDAELTDAAADVPFPAELRNPPEGLRGADGAPRLLFRLWSEHGLDALPGLRALTERRSARPANRERPVVIFGGAGFIGSNVADSLLGAGRTVRVFDNLGRSGVERNLRWLCERHGRRVEVVTADLRDARAVRSAVRDCAEVYHFAAQVAVTTSLVDPVHDFEVNARGTLNVLEAIRAEPEPPPLLFTSTNKVYGGLEDVKLRLRGQRYEPESDELRALGIGEARGVEFESPYGCSKGAADQYVIDYGRTFDLKTVVFRMSCIYGPRQFGNEDQGWVAHFLIRALKGEPITLYGDGKQVRDILFVEDLVRAMRTAMEGIDRLGGRAYNIGGGPGRTVSLLELLERIASLTGHAPDVRFEDWRTGDQRYYVSDIRRFGQASGWSPQVTVDEGVKRLHRWLTQLLGVGRAVAADAQGAHAL